MRNLLYLISEVIHSCVWTSKKHYSLGLFLTSLLLLKINSGVNSVVVWLTFIFQNSSVWICLYEKYENYILEQLTEAQQTMGHWVGPLCQCFPITGPLFFFLDLQLQLRDTVHIYMLSVFILRLEPMALFPATIFWPKESPCWLRLNTCLCSFCLKASPFQPLYLLVSLLQVGSPQECCVASHQPPWGEEETPPPTTLQKPQPQ